MNTEEYLHLFTKVEDWLPQLNGWYLTVRNEVNDHSYFYSDAGWSQYGVTHYLDLSKLTTIEKAIELAEDAYDEGRNYEDHKNNESFKIAPLNQENFIEQNKHIL